MGFTSCCRRYGTAAVVFRRAVPFEFGPDVFIISGVESIAGRDVSNVDASARRRSRSAHVTSVHGLRTVHCNKYKFINGIDKETEGEGRDGKFPHFHIRVSVLRNDPTGEKSRDI